MLKPKSISNKIVQSVFKSFRKLIPFAGALLLSFVLIFFMSQKISARKADLDKKKADEMQIEQPLTSIVTMEIIPGELKEIIRLPGVVAPWIALEVMSQVKGVVIKKTVSHFECKPPGQGSR